MRLHVSCILSDCDSPEVSVSESCTELWHSITPLWKVSNCGSWGGKPRKKKVTPTGGSQITDMYQLTDIWLIRSCGCSSVDTGTFSFADGYHCHILCLVLSHCSSRSCIFIRHTALFVLFLRFWASSQRYTSMSNYYLHMLIETISSKFHIMRFKLNIKVNIDRSVLFDWRE